MADPALYLLLKLLPARSVARKQECEQPQPARGGDPVVQALLRQQRREKRLAGVQPVHQQHEREGEHFGRRIPCRCALSGYATEGAAVATSVAGASPVFHMTIAKLARKPHQNRYNVAAAQNYCVVANESIQHTDAPDRSEENTSELQSHSFI